MLHICGHDSQSFKRGRKHRGARAGRYFSGIFGFERLDFQITTLASILCTRIDIDTLHNSVYHLVTWVGVWTKQLSYTRSRSQQIAHHRAENDTPSWVQMGEIPCYPVVGRCISQPYGIQVLRTSFVQVDIVDANGFSDAYSSTALRCKVLDNEA